jgi:hypothetical protein
VIKILLESNLKNINRRISVLKIDDKMEGIMCGMMRVFP